MHPSGGILLPFLATVAVAGTIDFYSNSDCVDGHDFDNYFFAQCGYKCTNVDPKKDKYIYSGQLESNQQIVVYQDKDCKGDAYTAIGQAYGSKAEELTCVAGPCEGFGSFEILVYNSTGGGEACPPGDLNEAPMHFTDPTGCDDS